MLVEHLSGSSLQEVKLDFVLFWLFFERRWIFCSSTAQGGLAERVGDGPVNLYEFNSLCYEPAIMLVYVSVLRELAVSRLLLGNAGAGEIFPHGRVLVSRDHRSAIDH